MGASIAEYSRPNQSAADGPLVSVVLATFEPEMEYLRQAIKSVVYQTYENVELVVIDSSDITWLQDLGESHHWVKYRRQEPAGLPAAWNAGIDAAQGLYLGFLADDDYYAPEKVATQVQVLKTDIDIVYSDEYVIKESGEIIDISSLPVKDPEAHYIDYFRVGHGVPHLTVMGRTKCFEEERFDESLAIREDPHLWVRLFKRYSVDYINEPLAYKRRRSDSATGDPNELFRNELREIQLLCEEFPELEEHRETRERMARYRYGKDLLEAGRIHEARRVLWSLLITGMIDGRVLAVFAAALLPGKQGSALRYLERLHQRLRG